MEKKYCPACKWFSFNPYGEDRCCHAEGRHVTGVPYRLIFMRLEAGPCGPDGRLYEQYEETIAEKHEGGIYWGLVGIIAIVALVLIVWTCHG